MNQESFLNWFLVSVVGVLLLVIGYFGFQIFFQTSQSSHPDMTMPGTLATSSVSQETANSAPSSIITSTFSTRSPLYWLENGVTFTLTKAEFGKIPSVSLASDQSALQLTFTLEASKQSCIDPNRFQQLVDEAGTLAAPASWSGKVFTRSAKCVTMNPGILTDEKVWFVVPASTTEMYIQGGPGNDFFSVKIIDTHTIKIEPPAKLG